MQQKYVVVGVVALALIGLSYFLITRPAADTRQQADIALQDVATSEPVETSATSPSPSSTTSETSDTSTDIAASDIKDGEYTAVGEYKAPSGMEKVGVTVTLKDGIIADAEVEILGINQTSKRMQGLFKEGYKEKVIGKVITEVKLDAVGGSSLTPKGFQDALQKILQEASA